MNSIADWAKSFVENCGLLAIFVTMVCCSIQHAYARHYGYLALEYQSDPSSIARDLPHRENVDWEQVSRQFSWATWEDLAAVLPTACPWLKCAD